MRITSEHQLHMFFGNRFGRTLIQGLQQFERACRIGFIAIDFEFFVAVGDFDLQRGFDGAQMFIQSTAQITQAGIA